MDDVLADDNRTLVHFPHMIGRTVHDQKNIGAGFTGTFCGFGKPDVLTDRYPEPGSLDVKYQRFLSRCEIAFFVKNSVIGHFLFEIGADDGSVCQYRARVVTKPVAGCNGGRQERGRCPVPPVRFSVCPARVVSPNGSCAEAGDLPEDNLSRDSSGVSTISAPRAAAWRANWAMRSRLPGRSPDGTVDLGNGDFRRHDVVSKKR